MARSGSVVLDVAFPADELDRARDALDTKRAGRAIGDLAEWTVTENDHDGLRRVRYQAHPTSATVAAAA